MADTLTRSLNTAMNAMMQWPEWSTHADRIAISNSQGRIIIAYQNTPVIRLIPKSHAQVQIWWTLPNLQTRCQTIELQDQSCVITRCIALVGSILRTHLREYP